MEKYQFEICANSVESCVAALNGGAQRVELCAGIPEGGTTPSYGEIMIARKLPSLKLHAIIRPRGGDFLYDATELAIMIEDIRAARRIGVDGLVFGCLDENDDVDINSMEKLMAEAGDCPVTFHRAFDRCRDPFAALELIISLGVKRILTSGQAPTAPQGVELIRMLVKKSQGRISIMAGCGVNENNIRQLAQSTGVNEFHFSAREKIRSSMKLSNPEVLMGSNGVDEYVREVTSARRVRQTIAALVDMQ